MDNITYICPRCHKTIHTHISSMDLANTFNTVDKLRGHPAIRQALKKVVLEIFDVSIIASIISDDNN